MERQKASDAPIFISKSDFFASKSDFGPSGGSPGGALKSMGIFQINQAKKSRHIDSITGTGGK